MNDDILQPDNLDNCEPCGTYKELRDFCYNEWFSSEGFCTDIYTDSEGYPSTGVGYLIYAPTGNGSKAEQRQRFKNDFKFYDKAKGRYLTPEEKGNLFDQIVKDYDANKLGENRRNLYPQYTQREDDVKYTFDLRFKLWYDVAKKDHPDLHEMPRSLAQVTMHMYWWGKGSSAGDVSHKLPYDIQAEKIQNVAFSGKVKPNRAIIDDLNAAIADCRYVVHEACITRNADGSIDHYTDAKKTVRLSTKYPEDKYPSGKEVNGQQVKEVWYRQEEPNKGGLDYTIGLDDTEYQYHEDGKTLDYTKDKNGNEVHYRKDGQTIEYTKDAKGNEIHYREDGSKEYTKDAKGNEEHFRVDGSLEYTKDVKGNEVHFREDGKTKDYTKDAKGNEVHFRADGKTKDYTKDKDGKEVHFREDGKTKDYTKDKNGNEVHFQDDGKKIDYTRDADNNEVHYQEGSNTLRYTRDKENNEVHYHEDGQTVDYTKDKDGNEVHYGTDGKVDYTQQDDCSVHYNDDGQVSSVQQDDLEVKLDNNATTNVHREDAEQTYDVYYEQDNVTRVENENGTVYYNQKGKVDLVEDSEGKKVSRKLFGSHPRKQLIGQAEEIKADAATRVDDLHIEERLQNSSTLIESAEEVKENSAKQVTVSQDLCRSALTDREVMLTDRENAERKIKVARATRRRRKTTPSKSKTTRGRTTSAASRGRSGGR